MVSASTNWKIDRPFTYEGVNGYYVNKITAFPTDGLAELPHDAPADIPSLGTHLREIAAEVGLTLTPCDLAKPYLWGEELGRQSPEKQPLLWRFREYSFALAMYTIGQLSASASADTPPHIGSHPVRTQPATFRIEDHSFTIVGSSELTSDIDITIQGPHSSYLISLIEDMFLTLTTDHGIPLRCWDVEFYGDFRLLHSVFTNFRKWSPAQRLVLIRYALVSYFRSTHQISPNRPPVIHPNVSALVYRALHFVTRKNNPDTPWMKRAYQGVVQGAYDFWKQTAPQGVLDRELFYRELAKVESESATIRLLPLPDRPSVLASQNEGITPEFAFSLFTAMATANIHRAESYVLPSTAVHVVEWEQKKVQAQAQSPADPPLPTSWFTSNARVGIDPFGFLLSAIEQLGYLEHYHPPNVPCSKKGVKYFGRYVRSLLHAGLLPSTTPFKPVYESLNTYRSTKDPRVACPYNIHELLGQILSATAFKKEVGPKKGERLKRGGGPTSRKRRGKRGTQKQTRKRE